MFKGNRNTNNVYITISRCSSTDQGKHNKCTKATFPLINNSLCTYSHVYVLFAIFQASIFFWTGESSILMNWGKWLGWYNGARFNLPNKTDNRGHWFQCPGCHLISQQTILVRYKYKTMNSGYNNIWSLKVKSKNIDIEINERNISQFKKKEEWSTFIYHKLEHRQNIHIIKMFFQ